MANNRKTIKSLPTEAKRRKQIPSETNLESHLYGESLNEKKYKSRRIVSSATITTYDMLSKRVTSGSCSDFKGKSIGIMISITLHYVERILLHMCML
jgi:hypothetical protein